MYKLLNLIFVSASLLALAGCGEDEPKTKEWYMANIEAMEDRVKECEQKHVTSADTDCINAHGAKIKLRMNKENAEMRAVLKARSDKRKADAAKRKEEAAKNN